MLSILASSVFPAAAPPAWLDFVCIRPHREPATAEDPTLPGDPPTLFGDFAARLGPLDVPALDTCLHRGAETSMREIRRTMYLGVKKSQ